MDQNFKALLFTDVSFDGYSKKLNRWCEPITLPMTATTLSDATKECSANPNCGMFYDRLGLGNDFKSCGEKAYILYSSANSILYQRQGNKRYTQF